MITVNGSYPLGRVAATGPCHVPGLLPQTGEIETVTDEDLAWHALNEYERGAPAMRRRARA